MLVLGAAMVGELLRSRESQVIDAVRDAYLAHARAESVLPHSSFLRLPGGRNRIIALPAYLDAPRPQAGVKWVASFPDNNRAGLDRASAAILLNSTTTGRPEALLEGSAISAQRTAASAALAASVLRPPIETSVVGVVGCGVINFEVVRFLQHTHAGIGALRVFDVEAERAESFAARCRASFPHLNASTAIDTEAVLAESSITSIATTAQHPHIFKLPNHRSRSVILHVSLRDLAPEVILACDNVVDDADHVCREQTSLHLAEQRAGNRDFIRCALADILLGTAPAGSGGSTGESRDGERPTVFSPFGLGILDLAVAAMVVDLARREGLGVNIEDFSPPPKPTGHTPAGS